MLTEKYEFDAHAISVIFKEFVKRKFNIPADTEYKTVTAIHRDSIGNYILDGITVQIRRNQDGEQAGNAAAVQSMADGDRKIDIGQL